MTRPRHDIEALTQTAFRLTEDELERLRVASGAQGLSSSRWIRLAIQEKLERVNDDNKVA
jgi:predicted DNA-binding protein